MIIIEVKGGAGNQLFQASHAYSTLNRPDEKVILHTRPLTHYKTKRDLFQPAWGMFNATERNGLGVRLILKLCRASSLTTRFLSFLGIKCLYGYYQDDVDLKYAAKALNAVASLSPSPKRQSRFVIHCRGGDYLEPPNDTIYHQLSLEDYGEAIDCKELDNTFAIIGNHESFTKHFTRIGAESLSGSITEDLMTMADAEKVICSNSTFAFWGAVFCLLNGGQASIPHKYYTADLPPNPFNCLIAKFPNQITYYGASRA